MKYQKPYIINGPNKPYIVPQAPRTSTLVQQMVKSAQKSSEQPASTKKAPWERERDSSELPSVYHNCPL